MLKALYDYAIRHDLTLPVGYVKKTVKAYILLYEDGTFQDIEPGGEEPVLAPDVGSLSQGKDKSNILIEKRSVVIPAEPTPKSAFFLSALKDGGQMEPMLSVCAKALEDPETADAIRRRLDEKKIKDGDRISFKVGFRSVLDGEGVAAWWEAFRAGLSSTKNEEHQLCLITGQAGVPVQTTMPIIGLHSVGGHAKGDALICFDKAAFCSYDKKKAANAPVSEEAFASVKAALDSLLEDAPTLAGMKFVHWYDFELSKEEDPVVPLIFGFESEEDEEEEPEDTREKERAAVKQADALVGSVKSGQKNTIDSNAGYYILLLSGVNGRVMIRRYERGSYADLQEKLALWQEDLRLIYRNGGSDIKSCELSARLTKLLTYRSRNDKKESKWKQQQNMKERMGKELSGLTPAILTAILTGGQLPDAVALRALAYIRSRLMAGDENAESDLMYGRDVMVWQWLKVWLLRNRGKRGILMRAYNSEYPSAAYHCGAWMAVYEAIQKTAMKDVNVTVVQRFYASAIQMPGLVVGRLSQLSIHHLEKIENKWLANQYREHLQKIGASIDGKIPATLNLEQQSEFALGYYQMGAELNRQWEERKAQKEQKEEE